MRGNSLILHFRPRTVPEKTLRFTLTWALGGTALVLLMLLAVTGILMKFIYEPVPAGAYASVAALQRDVWFGQFVRNMHHLSANFLVIVVFLHLLRVFFSGAFDRRRRATWVIGLALFFLILASNFTGYLLPWDQLAYWAITISTGMLAYIPGAGQWLRDAVLGGPQIGPQTLRLFFTLHTAFIPLCLIILLPYHFWRIRKAGGLVIPRRWNQKPEGSPVRLPAIPDLLLREMVASLVVIALIMLLAIGYNAPLASEANPGLSPNPTKAPWYFSGFQELLLHMHPLFAVFVIPTLAALSLLGLPFIPQGHDIAGIWFRSPAGRRLALASATGGVLMTSLVIVVDEWWIKPAGWLPGLAPEIRSGLAPTVVLLAVVAGYGRWLKKKRGTSRQEIIQAVFVLLMVSFLVLTVTGIWFRGPSMTLVWPWQTAGNGLPVTF